MSVKYLIEAFENIASAGCHYGDYEGEELIAAAILAAGQGLEVAIYESTAKLTAIIEGHGMHVAEHMPNPIDSSTEIDRIAGAITDLADAMRETRE